jgi:peptidoglycan/LPS O-acetylase OafA/YrhL
MDTALLEAVADKYGYQLLEFPHNLTLTCAKVPYLLNLYLPTHARFGPFYVGIILAISLLKRRNVSVMTHAVGDAVNTKVVKIDASVSTDTVQIDAIKADADNAAFSWGAGLGISVAGNFFMGCSFCTLFFLLLPDRAVFHLLATEVAMRAFTAAFRTVVAMAVAFLLYTVLVDSHHPWAAPRMKAFLSWRGWRVPAKLSFALYLFHIRVLIELLFLFASTQPRATFRPGYTFVLMLSFITTGICYGMGLLCDRILERPLLKVKNLITGSFKPKTL